MRRSSTETGNSRNVFGSRPYSVLLSAAESASACMAPLAMLLTGFVIANQALKSGGIPALLGDGKVYAACAIRLLGLPLLALALCRVLTLPDTLRLPL